MTKHRNPPIEVISETSPSGEITSARIRFGPHFIARVHDHGGKVTFQLVYTHHGFEADASELSGALERIIDEIRASHPEAVID